MTSVKRKICITSIITFLLAVACPLNVSAYDITTTVSPTGRAWEWGAGTAWRQAQQNTAGEVNNDSTGDAIFWGRFINNNYVNNYWILKTITSGNIIDFKEGYYYKTTLSMNVVAPQLASGEATGVQMPMLNRLVLPNNAPYKLVNISPVEYTCVEQYTGHWNATTVGTIYEYGTTACARGAISYDIIVQATQDATGRLQLGDGASWFLQSLVFFGQGTGYGTLRPLTITEYKPDNASVINQEQEQAGEQAQQDGQTAGNTAQTDAQTGSASLLQGASSIIGALTDTQASDCSINLNMGNVDLGTQNFCQGDIGPIRPVIATITNVLFAFVAFRVFAFLIGVMFGLFDEFFGTKTEKGGA